MVEAVIGKLFDSKAQTLVNTVNCVGVMGKGIALEFKNRFPEMFKDYSEKCGRKAVKLGRPYLYKPLSPPWILNFPTKDHWRSVSRIKDIIRGLECLIEHYKDWGITSMAVPPLGCGSGQLEWEIVGPTLFRYLSRMDIPVILYAPYDTPHSQLKLDFLAHEPLARPVKRQMPSQLWFNPAWVALVEILNRVEQEPYHWPIGRTTFQKMAYVVTEEGLLTDLQFRKGSFGPFSRELKGLITKLVNNGLIDEERLGNMLHVKVGTTFDDVRKEYHNYLEKWELTIKKIADLFMRMQTTSQAELMATVLFAASSLTKKKKEPLTESEILAEVMQWKLKRRPPLKQEEVAYTIRNLAALKWLKVKPSDDLPLPKEAGVDF